ncbi:MAG: hypothetical protein PHF21_03120, partial [Bacilli bacterium]|nr:hypothetical protein [Bacilli bacterium]
MIEHKNYLSYVLENNLAISKFMLDHSLIVLAMIAFKDKEIKSIFEKEFEEYEEFILEIIPFSYNKITKKFAESNILISDYTIALNDKTCELYKVQDNKEINNNCVNLILNAMTNDLDINQDDYLKIISFNKKSLNKLNNSLNILHHLKKELFDDKVQIFFSHDFIDHLIKETETFLYTLLFFEKDMNYTPTYVYSCNFYYNLFLKDHLVYIKEMTFTINF